MKALALACSVVLLLAPIGCTAWHNLLNRACEEAPFLHERLNTLHQDLTIIRQTIEVLFPAGSEVELPGVGKVSAAMVQATLGAIDALLLALQTLMAQACPEQQALERAEVAVQNVVNNMPLARYAVQRATQLGKLKALR